MAAENTLKLAFILSATDKMSRIVDQAVKKSTDKLSAFERTTGKIGKSMVKAGSTMVAAGAAVGGAMFGVAKSTADYGDEVLKTSQRVGVGVEQWERMAYAARVSGVDNNQLADTMAKLGKRMSDAVGGNKAYMQTFKDLGIQIKDSEGKMRNPIDVFNDLSEVFHNVEDGAAKTALATELFGDSGTKLIPFLNTGKEGLKALGDEAEKTGNVIGEDAARASEKFNEKLRKLTEGFKGAKNQLGVAFMPVLSELIEKVSGIISKVTEWVQANPKLTATIAKIGMGVAGLLIKVGSASVLIGGLTFVVGQFGKVFRAVSAAVNIGSKIMQEYKNGMLLFRVQYAALQVQTALAAVKQWLFNTALFGCPIVWIIAGIMAVIAAVVLLVKNWDKVAAFFSKLWGNIKKMFSAAWEWIKKMFLNYTPAGLIIKHWDKISGFFVNLWAKVKEPFIKTWQWIKDLFLKYHPIGILISNWDKVAAWFGQIWDKIKGVFSAGWQGIADFFTGLPTKMFEWGKNILMGLWNGITSMVNKVIDGVKNIGKKIAGGFKSFFGINSPSKLFAEYGVNLTQGLVIGMNRGGSAVESATGGMAAHATSGISQSMQSSTVNASTVMNGGNAGVSLTYSPQITISGPVTSETRDEFSKMLKQHANDIIAIIRRDAENTARLSFNA